MTLMNSRPNHGSHPLSDLGLQDITCEVALDQLPAMVPEILPSELRERLSMLPRRQALEESHFPPNDTSVALLNAFRAPAQRRLIFEEFFLFQLGHAWRRHVSRDEPFVAMGRAETPGTSVRGHVRGEVELHA